MKEIFPLLILVALIVSYFFQDWRAYECDEYLSEGAYRSGDTLSIHEKGGIISKWDGTTRLPFKMKYNPVEGTKFISYVRPDTGTWDYKLNKEDLTYYYRLGDRSGQCRKVGFFDKLSKGSFNGLDW